VLRHCGGASSTAALSLTAPPAAAGTAVELRGDAGVSRLPAGGRDPVAALGRAVDALLESADSGRPHACDAAFGLQVVEVLARAEEYLTKPR
jgi:hypothetical protein